MAYTIVFLSFFFLKRKFRGFRMMVHEEDIKTLGRVWLSESVQ